MENSLPFLTGVNYWPRRKAMSWWSDFDASEVDEEFAMIHSLGLDVVRIFLLWEDFQPQPDQVSSASLDHLGVVCDAAQKHGLKLDVTFFTGHMSGPNWSPRWLLGTPAVPNSRQVVSGGKVVQGSYRNPFSDPVALSAESGLLRAVVSAYKDHDAIWMWNLGNEPDLFAHPASARAGRQWVHDSVQTIKALDPAHPVTCGLHTADVWEDTGLRVNDVFAETDVAVMHAYPMYTPWARDPLDPDFVPFTCALTQALGNKPVLMEEFGGCTTGPGEPSSVWEWEAWDGPRRQFMASEEALAEYLEAVLPRLVRVGATGAMLWCFADYVPELWDRPPCDQQRHERFFGLVRPDGSLKPHAEVLRNFAATKPRIQPPHPFKLGMTPDEFYKAPMDHVVGMYHSYLDSL
ncbi:MAG TPA: beta-galactosidase [Aggregatilineales bacterium]|nr:beta-galactosidase [Aggregatilineales bacterium]